MESSHAETGVRYTKLRVCLTTSYECKIHSQEREDTKNVFLKADRERSKLPCEH